MTSPVQEHLQLIMHAISGDQHEELLKVLTQAAEKNILRDVLQHRDPNGYTLIHFAVSKTKPRALEIVLQFASLQGLLRDVLLSLDNAGFTILHFAVFMGNTKTVSILLYYAQSVGVLDRLRDVLGPGNRDIQYYAHSKPEILRVLDWRGDDCRPPRRRNHGIARSSRRS